MRPVVFTRDEANYILSAIDQRIEKSADGVVAAAIGVAIVEKLREALEPAAAVGEKPEPS